MKKLLSFLLISTFFVGCSSKPFVAEVETKIVKEHFTLPPSVFEVEKTPIPHLTGNNASDIPVVKNFIKDLLAENIKLRSSLNFIQKEMEKHNGTENK